MSMLPDELWLAILDAGVAAGRLGHRELCCLSIACRRLRRLSDDPALWSRLLAQDFPQPHPPATPSKSVYQSRFERDKARRVAAWRRRVMRAESQVAVCGKNLEDLAVKMVKEGERMKLAAEEIANLERARQASVALNVWQPEVVCGSQRQLVEQCTVPIESRLSALKMEVKVCKQQIAIFNKAYNDQKEKLNESKNVLKSLTYNPMQDYQSNATTKDSDVKQKKLKRCRHWLNC